MDLSGKLTLTQLTRLFKGLSGMDQLEDHELFSRFHTLLMNDAPELDFGPFVLRKAVAVERLEQHQPTLVCEHPLLRLRCCMDLHRGAHHFWLFRLQFEDAQLMEAVPPIVDEVRRQDYDGLVHSRLCLPAAKEGTCLASRATQDSSGTERGEEPL